MKKQKNSIKFEGKLIQTLRMEELGELVQNYIELGIDSLLDEGLAKDIPIIGTIAKLAKVAGSVRNRLYLTKLVHFLQKVSETTQQERERFIEENCKAPQHFEQAVLLLLEQADHMEKTTLIGKVFKACILGKISYADTFQISEMVNRAYWADLKHMFEGKESKEQQQRLFTAGLMEFDPQTFQFATTDGSGLDVIRKLGYKRNTYAIILTMVYQEKFEDLPKCSTYNKT